MKKKLLFVINNLNCGGAEKALISLLETIDYSRFDIDLLLFKQEGIFMSKIPEEVNLLSEPECYKYFDMSIKIALLELIKKGRIDIAIARLLFGYVFKTEKSKVIGEQKVWKYLSAVFSRLDTEYDVAIGYLEKNPIYFCVDKVKAKKKIGWIHNDYEKLGMDKNIDNKYFNNLDYIFTVSEECLNILKNIFPQYNDKFKLMHNIVSAKTIRKLSLEEISDVKFSGENINIVSVGRLNYQKGFEMAIEACSILKEKGYKIKWNIVGEGEERSNLERLIKKFNIEDEFKLLGIRENPYSYIAQSDIYVQSSRFEGKSIAIDEAKILNKPIVLTSFSTAKDQIENNSNGVICDMDSSSLANYIEKLIKNDKLKNKLIRNLSKENWGNENEIKNLYGVIDIKE
ncbi:glycosyltransferase [Clostridium perfringens]|uniref:glycosyltransferase n=1 Tax=Clostridium perfringens TaxID=1502 RepID=UPI0018E4720C|nr:glycosyltransferase [Clostridium perfringens]MBI5987097.1 glycosyltransferase [Clostridium perfringens]MDK0601189.1 glycosyltransferase [Clostridium perfringens]MDK0604069.1 glycosyltransferase [Clostridium perfringens]MDM0668103.1 glycosyltransferase [Clostridium perfringens]MDM0674337.1 glycosyltransferase [Clostridium perfringens]